MKNLKNKIAAIVCGLGLLAVTSTPVMAQNCVYVSYTCCGEFHWGDYDLNSPSVCAEIILDFLVNCSCTNIN